MRKTLDTTNFPQTDVAIEARPGEQPVHIHHLGHVDKIEVAIRPLLIDGPVDELLEMLAVLRHDGCRTAHGIPPAPITAGTATGIYLSARRRASR